MPEQDVEQIRAACTRFLAGHYPQTPHAALAGLAAAVPADLEDDFYGKGGLIEDFETEMAALLGKPAAVFMPSGTMAQQIALRIWAERTGRRNVAFHPTCHLEIHEEQGYRLLHRLHGVLVGNRFRLMTLQDLEAVSVPLGTLLLELPQRHLGGVLPTWEDLTAMLTWAKERGIVTHMDGARLWESRPFYGRSYAEIAALFDTVYVSFYKTVGGIAGALLAGPADVIAEARVWQRRHGGNLIHLYPYVLAAQQGLAQRLERVDAYYHKAIALAQALAGFPELEITPNPPHTNRMLIFIRGEQERLQQAALEIAQEKRVWLFHRLAPSQLPAYQVLDLMVGDATLDLSDEAIAGLFADLLRRAQGGGAADAR